MSRTVLRWIAALALFATLVALRVSQHYPSLPNPLTVGLVLDRGEAGRADPLIVAGRWGEGDFLSVRFVDESTIQFVYDSWGHPGIPSQPVKVKPGETLRLTMEMPAFDQVQGGLVPPSNRVRVTCNGATVLDVIGHFFVREPAQIFFGENPLGGTACGASLRGQIIVESGRTLRGDLTANFSRRDRLFDWLIRYPRQVTALLLFSLAVGLFGHRLRSLAGATRILGLAAIRHRWFVGSSVFATLCYAWLVTMGTFQFNHGEFFGSFYDYQAASLLQGRLDVPEDAIGGEAFEARGKLYGYFGPTPALLRMPFAIAGFAFGKLSRTFMVAYFVASLLASYLVLRHALKLARRESFPPDDNPLPSPFAVVVLVVSVGLGSTLFFLGSRGLIFHEAILAGITFALWSCWCSLRHLEEPCHRWWVGALAGGVLSIHARPPTGLFALTFLGCVCLIIAARSWRARSERDPKLLRQTVGIAVACGLGVLSLNGLAWLKFRTFDAAPLRLSRPYTDPGRLERIEGKSFHLVNLPFNFDTYVLRPNFRLEPGFPWVYLGSNHPRREFPKAKMDLLDHTLAMPYAMPSLFGLATLGCAAAMLAFRRMRAPVFALWFALLPMALALFAAVATAQRYTGDFCPFLICAAAFGLAAVESASTRWRFALRAAIGLATVWAVFVTVAITLHYQGETLWGVPGQTKLNYQQLRRRVDGWFGQETLSPGSK